MTASRIPLCTIRSSAPIRICDNGGWTDTWFAQHGKIFNIAVSPDVQVQLRAFAATSDRLPITIHAVNFGEHYSIARPNGHYGKHPLIEAVFDYLPPPSNLEVELSIQCDAPPGSSTGTSASAAVAVLGAVDRLTPGRLSPAQIAAAAHSLETKVLHRQSGIQDQIAAAYGGINFIRMATYPHWHVEQLLLPDALQRELESLLALVVAGEAHSSSDVHEMVIRELESSGPDDPRLVALRQAAEKARAAVCSGDFSALGQSFIENTEAQRQLHPELIGSDLQAIIEIARAYGALGWKVNGAGGRGGSVSLLGPRDPERRNAMLEMIPQVNATYRNIPVRLNSDGLRVDEVIFHANSESANR